MRRTRIKNDCGRKNVLCAKILAIEGSAFNQNYKKNEECNNIEIIGRKKNTDITSKYLATFVK